VMDLPRVSLIIPAYNEAPTVGEVLRVAAASGLFHEIILVDDGSSDGTSRAYEQAREHAASQYDPARVPPDIRLVSHPRNMGKAVAMRDGLQLATGNIVMFIDADLLGLKPEHMKAMLAPLLDDSDYRSSLGVFVGGRAATTMAQKIAPFISGQRACFRDDLQGFKAWERVGFGVETALNRYLQEKNVKVRVVELENLTHRMKEEKRGAVRGFGARLKMYWDILTTWVQSKFTRYSGDAR